MLLKFNYYGILLILVSILSLYFTIHSIKKREDIIYLNFGLLSLFCFINFLSQGLECLFNSFYIQLILAHLSALGYVFIPATWLLLSYNLVNDNQDLNKKWKVILFAIPVLSAILVITNPIIHGFADYALPTASTVYKLQLVVLPHLGHTLSISYNFLCALIILIIILYGLIKGSKIFRNAYLIYFITTAITLFISLLYYTPLYPGFHFAILAYLLTLIFLFISVFIYHKFDLVSIVNQDVIHEFNSGVLYFNVNDKLLSANPSSSLIDVSKDDLERNVTDIFKNHEEILNFYNDDSSLIQLEMNEKWVEIKKISMHEDEMYLGKILLVNDISNNILELKQKDMLVKEVNHRVKNNLQIILSLINLDIRYHPNDSMSVIDATRLRLTYMSSLHDKLYSSSSMDKVDIKDYLPDISRSLIQMYDSDIQVFEDVTSCSIDLDLAVSLGLILTEVINNTIKYAFNDNDKGKFFIKFEFENNIGVLDLFDNGEGLPDGFDFESSTGLGMTVIKSLTQQINGKLNIIPDEGAHFKIKFPLN